MQYDYNVLKNILQVAKYSPREMWIVHCRTLLQTRLNKLTHTLIISLDNSLMVAATSGTLTSRCIDCITSVDFWSDPQTLNVAILIN